MTASPRFWTISRTRTRPARHRPCLDDLSHSTALSPASATGAPGIARDDHALLAQLHSRVRGVHDPARHRQLVGRRGEDVLVLL
ncbi:hypothetical protein BS329_41310 [Amycolatopsis coloradensis]|uniref:Uncharacterized protein n=1 Tax=Amycolatopsis coloradensis TaxID=76021 RepID=A0A1R0KDE7_9PSEU|nr:hypothetical protein BS329_41310 [Amycolatopsis coloradensis]